MDCVSGFKNFIKVSILGIQTDLKNDAVEVCEHRKSFKHGKATYYAKNHICNYMFNGGQLVHKTQIDITDRPELAYYSKEGKAIAAFHGIWEDAEQSQGQKSLVSKCEVF